ncbi:MAG: hypothetical protein EXX96DRAFT_201447 [Benjaminiella poitrasii]|nr:MAG: hypothetical protein EXX96DRAFT_201447 [Benjaminiella poitrasii]
MDKCRYIYYNLNLPYFLAKELYYYYQRTLVHQWEKFSNGIQYLNLGTQMRPKKNSMSELIIGWQISFFQFLFFFEKKSIFESPSQKNNQMVVAQNMATRPVDTTKAYASKQEEWKIGCTEDKDFMMAKLFTIGNLVSFFLITL